MDPFAPPTGPPPVEPPGRPFGEPPPPSRVGRATLALGLIALLLAVTFFPLGLAVAVTALVLGVRELRAARRLGAPASGKTLVGVIAAGVALVLAVLWTAAVLAFLPELRRYAECTSGANTVRDEQECRDNFTRDLQRRLGVSAAPLSSPPPGR